MPDFIVAGVQKSGTSWLYGNLNKIELFDLPPIKEFHYFDRSDKYLSPDILRFKYLINRVRSLKWLKKVYEDMRLAIHQRDLKKIKFFIKFYFSTYDDNWYKTIFDLFDQYTGEITPSYSFLDKKDIEKMILVCPKTKIILMFRNPIERAWSHYKHELKLSNIEYQYSYDEIVNFMDSSAQEIRSNYQEIIQKYTDVVPKSRLLFGFFDAISSQPQNLLGEIATFISGHEAKVNVQAVNQVLNSSYNLECPLEIRLHLKNKYHDMMLHLKTKYGGHFARWYDSEFQVSSDSTEYNLQPTMSLI